MARSGRKRKIGAKRRQTTRAGRIPERVGPSLEQIERKAALLRLPCATIEEQRIVLARDASTPIAILAARALLKVPGDDTDPPKYHVQDLQEVGEDYARLYWRAIGSPYPVVGGYRDVARGSLPSLPMESDDAALEARFNRLSDVLDAAGRDIAKATKSLVVDGEWPADLPGVEGMGKSKWRLAPAIEGLKALVDFRYGRRT